MTNERSLRPFYLDDLLVPGPVERGFYIASGPRHLIPLVLDGLVRFLRKNDLSTSISNCPPLPQNGYGETSARTGEGSIAPKPISRFSLTRNTLAGGGGRRPSYIGSLIWVDSGNLFDAYHVSRSAREHGLDPKRVLRSIQVGRPFTAFQLCQILDKVPRPALWASPPPEHWQTDIVEPKGRLSSSPFKKALTPPSAGWWTPLVILSDLMGLFCDPELPAQDQKRSFDLFRMKLAALKERAIVVGLLLDETPVQERRALLPKIMGLARRLNVGCHPEPKAKDLAFVFPATARSFATLRMTNSGFPLSRE